LLNPCDRVDQDEGVALGDRQSLHRRELVAAGGVRDLEGAHILLVARDHLSIGIFDGGHVAVGEGALHEAKHNRRFAHSAGAEDRNAVVARLLNLASSTSTSSCGSCCPGASAGAAGAFAAGRDSGRRC